MPKQLQIRGGTTAQHSTFTGALREITVDTDKDTLVVHDGSTVGGFPLARESVVNALLGTKVNKNADIVSGTATKVTYDSKGLVTGSTTLSASDIPSLDASKITTGTLILDTTGSASKITTARNIAITGDITWSASFDGSANVTGTATLATVIDSGTGTFKKIAIDTKGRVTGTQSVTQTDITGLLGAGSITNAMLANGAVANLSGTNTGDETVTTIKTKLGITTLSGSNTGDQTITLTGDVAGSGTGSFVVTLANSGVTAGTYDNVTVDAKGRVTSATNNDSANISALNI